MLLQGTSHDWGFTFVKLLYWLLCWARVVTSGIEGFWRCSSCYKLDIRVEQQGWVTTHLFLGVVEKFAGTLLTNFTFKKWFQSSQSGLQLLYFWTQCEVWKRAKEAYHFYSVLYYFYLTFLHFTMAYWLGNCRPELRLKGGKFNPRWVGTNVGGVNGWISFSCVSCVP